MQIPKVYQMLSWTSSTATSGSVFAGDARNLSVSLTTTAGSVVTLQGSNADGFTAAIPAGTWSTVTVFTAPGIYAVQPGMRWLRAQQAASSSSASLALAKLMAD